MSSHMCSKTRGQGCLGPGASWPPETACWLGLTLPASKADSHPREKAGATFIFVQSSSKGILSVASVELRCLLLKASPTTRRCLANTMLRRVCGDRSELRATGLGTRRLPSAARLPSQGWAPAARPARPRRLSSSDLHLQALGQAPAGSVLAQRPPAWRGADRLPTRCLHQRALQPHLALPAPALCCVRAPAGGSTESLPHDLPPLSQRQQKLLLPACPWAQANRGSSKVTQGSTPHFQAEINSSVMARWSKHRLCQARAPSSGARARGCSYQQSREERSRAARPSVEELEGPCSRDRGSCPGLPSLALCPPDTSPQQGPESD